MYLSKIYRLKYIFVQPTFILSREVRAALSAVYQPILILYSSEKMPFAYICAFQ